MMLPELVKESHGFNRGSMSISDEEEVTGTCIVVSGNTQASDHGDRSGGLLIGYIGLITVPVALERTN